MTIEIVRIYLFMSSLLVNFFIVHVVKKKAIIYAWVCIKCEPASRASHAVHWRIIEKNTIKIENNNTENINWTLTIVNKCLTLNSA